MANQPYTYSIPMDEYGNPKIPTATPEMNMQPSQEIVDKMVGAWNENIGTAQQSLINQAWTSVTQNAASKPFSYWWEQFMQFIEANPEVVAVASVILLSMTIGNKGTSGRRY